VSDGSAYRLPRTVVPRRYELVLEPDLEAGTFTGSESVEVEVREPVEEIVLNAADLDVTGGSLVGPAGVTGFSARARCSPRVSGLVSIAP